MKEIEGLTYADAIDAAQGVADDVRHEMLTEDAVREIIREHDRRLAARLRERCQEIDDAGPDGSQGEGLATALKLATMSAVMGVAEILEADDA